MKNEDGFVGAVVVTLLVVGLLFAMFTTQMSWSDQNVSGIVYNTKNNKALTGNTTFSVRAGENTPVTTENESAYCLPPNSPYKELVNRAAADKKVKVNITTKKFFKFPIAPWTCYPNVTVTEVK